MRIENIIDDIIQDITELQEQLQASLEEQYPGHAFTLSVPRLEELSPIKTFVLRLQHAGHEHTVVADIHTHNDDRVFLHETVEEQGLLFHKKLEDQVVHLLRELIRKRKLARRRRR